MDAGTHESFRIGSGQDGESEDLHEGQILTQSKGLPAKEIISFMRLAVHR